MIHLSPARDSPANGEWWNSRFLDRMKLVEVLLMNLGGIFQGIRQDFNLLEIVLLFAAWQAWRRGWRPQWGWHVRVRRPGLAAVGVAAAVVALRLAITPVFPAPVPIVTDEFSHQLLADTLMEGRLANPTHPYWQHFESLHIIQQPHYVSNYFPGHAAILAAGMWLLRDPWAGVLAETFVFLAVLYWSLLGWMPGRWALFGVIVAGLRFGIASYWVNAFHGGFLPAIGGAFVLGASARLLRGPALGDGLLFGLGGALLLVSRPFEGAMFCLPITAALAWKLRGNIPGLLKTAAACILLLGATGAALAVYFKAVTGSPFTTAYSISQKTYGWPMALAWTPPPKIQHRHVEFAAYYDYEVSEHEKVAAPVGFVESFSFRAQEYWRFFFGPVLSIPLLMWKRVWRRRKIAMAGLCGVLCAVGLEGASSPHYAAPATAVLVLLVVDGVRHLQASRIRIAMALPAVMLVVLTLRIGAENLGLPFTQRVNFQTWCCRVEGNRHKAKFTAKLDRIAGDHLVFVKPKTDPYNFLQWIYNRADIDKAHIVWARDLGAEKNAALRKHFATRKVWIVDPNVEPATMTPLRMESAVH